MTDPDGGFYSAEDADSLLEKGKPEHAEGAFYVWTQGGNRAALGEDAPRSSDRIYGVEAEGNAPAGSDPQGEFTGKNILIQRLTLAGCREVLPARARPISTTSLAAVAPEALSPCATSVRARISTTRSSPPGTA